MSAFYVLWAVYSAISCGNITLSKKDSCWWINYDYKFQNETNPYNCFIIRLLVNKKYPISAEFAVHLPPCRTKTNSKVGCIAPLKKK